MEIIIAILSIIIISYLFSFILFKLLKVPHVVSLIILGLIFGMQPISRLYFQNSLDHISTLGTIGLFFLMFIAGLKTSWKKLHSEEKDSFAIALFALIIPLSLGFSVSYILLDLPFVSSLVIGICMSITAEATKTQVLIDLKKLNTKVGSAMIGAGILDDFAGLVLFSAVLFVAGELHYTEYLILFGVLFAFILGMLSKHFAKEHHLTKKIEFIGTNFFIPFFFVNMGLLFNLGNLEIDLLFVFIILIVAIIGKLLGTYLAKPYVSFDKKQLLLIGWGMNSRGAVELALVLMAFNAGLIATNTYSALVLMTLVTTAIFPFIITYIIKNNRSIMN